ncbi:hypothetical protein JCM21900_006823 [Sporobolomyces salmonicolor]
MFPTSKLFGLCPDYQTCKLSPCLFSHAPPPATPAASSSSTAALSSLKRPAPASASGSSAPSKAPRVAQSLAGVRVVVKGAGAAVVKAAATTAPVARAAGRSQPPAPAASTSKVTLDVDSNVDTGPPRLPMAKGAAHTPTVTRQKMLNALHSQFVEIYTPGVLPTSVRYSLASQHALKQEQTLYARSTKATYRNACISALARLKKRSPARSADDAGTIEDEAERSTKQAEEKEGRLTRERVDKFLHDEETLAKFGYMLEVPDGLGGDNVTEVGNVRKCDRCGKEFTVKEELNETDRQACQYHYGRMVTEKVSGVRQRVWSCCPSVGAQPCQVGPHVFKDEEPIALHSRVPFVPSSSLRTSSSDSSSNLPPPLDLVALDCELIYTASGMSLARLTVLSPSGSLLLDEHIRPPSAVLDLNTRFSGVREDDLQVAVLDVGGVGKALARFMSEETIVVGHGVENDLKALRLVHKRVIDTAILFPHPNGGTWRYALRNLTKDILGKFIQDSDPTIGHSAKDDASAALELVRWKVKQEARGKAS